MKKIFFVFLFFSFTWSLCARDFFVPWNKDQWNSTQGLTPLHYDKVEHALFFGGLTTTVNLYIGDGHGWQYVFALGIANEIKDGLLDYRQVGWVGGEGFSTKDLLANCAGQIAGYYLYKIISPAIQKGQANAVYSELRPTYIQIR